MVLDAWNGYHSLPLLPAARDTPTFITEWGQYRYRQAPQGFHGSEDGYTRRFDDIKVAMVRKSRCIDGSLLWDNSIESFCSGTLSTTSTCVNKGIVFNPDKFHFTEMEVEFAGFPVTANGVKPTKKMTGAILHFPTRTCITGIRSWFGLMNQVSYAFSQAEVMAPSRELQRTKKQKLYWDETLERLFRESKWVILQRIEKGVKTFEINRTTFLATDYCKIGICYFFLIPKATALARLTWIAGMTTGSAFWPGPALPMIRNCVTRQLREKP